MLRQKIDYGIDLGTTNSAIARMDNGQARILKSERLQKDTTPSCVYYTKRGQLLVGDVAYSRVTVDPENTKTEFKRTMGTAAKHTFPSIEKGYTSEELSAEILKTLRNSVKDEDFNAAVITVPADFDQVQIEATQKAAELAGFDYCELVQEPIAASLAYGIDVKNIDGTWLVFDMGGGTFDAALMRADFGEIRVVDTAGDNYLGGKNMDHLIFNDYIIPQLKKEFKIDGILSDSRKRRRLETVWKKYVEQYKIELSSKTRAMIEPDDPSVMQDDSGVDMDTCIVLERPQFESLIKPMVDRAIAITQELLTRNRMDPRELVTVLLIGGPTYIPYIRERIRKEINENINVSIDPMTAVAVGAAMYASTRLIPDIYQKHNYSRVQLSFAYPYTTLEKEVNLGLGLNRNIPGITIPRQIFVEINRSDGAWTTGRVEMENDAIIIRLHLLENRTNGYNIRLYDDKGNRVECEPSEFSILQGIKIANPPLPHDICVEAETDDLGHTIIPLLMKNQVLPAIGKKSFKVKKTLRPGHPEDLFNIIVREGERHTRPVRNIKVGDISISGANLTETVPEGSDVEITLKMDESRRINVAAYFPAVDQTIENVLETSYRTSEKILADIGREIGAEAGRLSGLKKAVGDTPQPEIDALERQLGEISKANELRGDDPDKGFELLNRLNEAQLKIDTLEKRTRWVVLGRDLEQMLQHVRMVVDLFGKTQDKADLASLQMDVETAVRNMDDLYVKKLKEKMLDLRHRLLQDQPGYWIALLLSMEEYVNDIAWSDRKKAEGFIARGKTVLNTGYSDEIRTLVRSLWGLMSKEEQVRSQTLRTNLPFYQT